MIIVTSKVRVNPHSNHSHLYTCVYNTLQYVIYVNNVLHYRDRLHRKCYQTSKISDISAIFYI